MNILGLISQLIGIKTLRLTIIIFFKIKIIKCKIVRVQQLMCQSFRKSTKALVLHYNAFVFTL